MCREEPAVHRCPEFLKAKFIKGKILEVFFLYEMESLHFTSQNIVCLVILWGSENISSSTSLLSYFCQNFEHFHHVFLNIIFNV